MRREARVSGRLELACRSDDAAIRRRVEKAIVTAAHGEAHRATRDIATVAHVLERHDNILALHVEPKA